MLAVQFNAQKMNQPCLDLAEKPRNDCLFVSRLNMLFCSHNMTGFLKYCNCKFLKICDPGPQNSLKSLGYIWSNIQKYIAWVKIIDFSCMPKINRILSKDHVP